MPKPSKRVSVSVHDHGVTQPVAPCAGRLSRSASLPPLTIDIYAAPGTFADPARLAREAASELMAAERLPDLPIFRANTAAFVHDVLFLADVNGDGACVRVQVLTPHAALDRDKQRDAVARLTTLVAASSAVPPDRVWVLLTEGAEGGWGIAGRALGAEDIAAVARQT